MIKTHYFTFGFDHTFPDGRPAQNEYVIVESNCLRYSEYRTVFMAWLGGNGFAAEYDLEEWTTLEDTYEHNEPVSMQNAFYGGQEPAYVLSVIEGP